ncbi:MBL fold metallo-hydrolase [Hydrogenophaga sp.]|uniref:MBL fold metallo-hydrolase n=1 Tax=Hydrogenophaga sp. TaxID=1904254 RepID=UPI002730028C|nr:MBL fold metallo-hydrolase [Hydrogenophaga sp.]MDP2017329.1 MBL fold metallo-hydrolase [Hydrogenophaga sp.]MDP3812556.1 MBL fold metallo-hydrolase [Hydrogenophaga sp.]
MFPSLPIHAHPIVRHWLVCALALGLAALSVSATAQTAPEMTPQKVGPNTWYVQGQAALGSPANQNFISNAGFVVAPRGVVVIDALGSPALARRLVQKIAEITPKPITHVIVTHYHADHIYGLQVFKELGAQIIAQQDAREYLNSDTAAQRLVASRTELAPWVDEHTRLVPADRWLADSTTLELAGMRFVVERVGPSHTPEDLAIHVPTERVLFAGDLMFAGRLPFVGKADSGQWIASLDRLLRVDATVVVPGHGAASTEPRKDMVVMRDYLNHLRTTMGKAAKDLVPFEEAYSSTDWSRFEPMPMFRFANRMNAYNTYLLMEEESLRGR